MRSILTVDDSASMRQMVAFTLKHAGYQVVEAVAASRPRRIRLRARWLPRAGRLRR